MCGLAGVYDRTGQLPIPEHLTSFLGPLSHRGPDGRGTRHCGRAGLAHTRLSIIDLSDRGSQPMSNEDDTVWVVFNGEIYNHRSLRDELVARGHRFRSATDTEVLVHLYEEKGLDFVQELRGMFALALYDQKLDRLVLVRDRMGQKPLYYALSDETLVFASELKAIRAFLERSGRALEIDPESLPCLLAYDYLPAPRTMYRGIAKLPPAHRLVAQGGDVEISKYWSLDLRHKLRISESEASERLLSLLDESVRLRLVADVPLGMFLSGGVDSSMVVGLASRHVDHPIKTFSIGYDDPETRDLEFPFSRLVSKRFGTDHREVGFDPGMIEELPRLMHFYDEPFCIPNALAHYQLCRMTRQHVTVALSGDGADECLAGYLTHKRWRIIEALGSMPGVLRSAIPGRWMEGRAPGWKTLVQAAPGDRLALQKQLALRNTLRLLRPGADGELPADAIAGPLDGFRAGGDCGSFMDGVLQADLLVNYAWACTVAADVSGMSNGLEIRSPFLDHELVEFAFSLPVHLRLKRFRREKYILYRAAEGVLPREITSRKKTPYGAGIPFRKLFFGVWEPFVRERLSDPGIEAFGFERGHVARLYDRTRQSHDYESYWALWKLLCIQCWRETAQDSA